eukprot:2669770-Prymnesium_polylepis.1
MATWTGKVTSRGRRAAGVQAKSAKGTKPGSTSPGIWSSSRSLPARRNTRRGGATARATKAAAAPVCTAVAPTDVGRALTEAPEARLQQSSADCGVPRGLHAKDDSLARTRQASEPGGLPVRLGHGKHESAAMPKNWFPGQPHWPLPRRTLPAAHTHAATLAAPATVVVVWVGQREHAVALVAPISELKVPELHSIAWP